MNGNGVAPGPKTNGALPPLSEPPHHSKKTLRITASDGSTIEIAHGEYYMSVKARRKRLMKNSLTSEARRVYECLELGTLGWKQELAVVKTKTGQRPMRTGDISHFTGLDHANVRRGLRDLEAEGLAKREGDDKDGMRKAHQLIYAWAIPRQPDPQVVDAKKGASKKEVARDLFPDWYPVEWEPLRPIIQRFKLQLKPDLGVARDLLLEQGKEVARAYEKAEKEVIEFLESRAVLTPLIKKGDKDSSKDKDGATTTTVSSPSSEPPSSSSPPPPPPAALDPAFDEVTQALEPYCTVTDDRVQSMINACRAVCPDATGTELAHFIAAKGTELRKQGKIRDMYAMLLRIVPPCLKGRTFQLFRDRQAASQAQEREREAQEREREVEMARRVLDDPEADGDTVRWAHLILGAKGAAL